MSFLREMVIEDAGAIQRQVGGMTTKDQLLIKATLTVAAGLIYVGDQIAESNKTRASLSKKV